MTDCRMEYGRDEKGQEVLLKDGKFQVMMEWEKPYMQACIDALKPFGDVLEIGFGLGYSATQIQRYHPKSHIIIEYHPDVAKEARKWAENYPNVTIIEATWQSALPTLGLFDAIFFDDYPLFSESQMHTMEEESSRSQLLLNQGNKLLSEVEEQLPFLTSLKYSTSDLEAFRGSFSLQTPEERKQLLRFFYDLSQKKQISEEQMAEQLAWLRGEGKMPEGEITAFFAEQNKRGESLDSAQIHDRLYYFLSECLKKHMRKGSRFSCFLGDAVSKFEDKRFFDTIITHPDLDYHEEFIEIEVPPHCAYYQGTSALVITIQKHV